MKSLVLSLAMTFCLGSVAFAYGTKTAKSASAPAVTLDIVDTAVGAGQFKTLAAALTAADLVATLKGSGPFTVFAPTDAAFKKLPKGTLENLLKPENKATLAKILTYHVVSGQVMAKDVQPGPVKSVEGSDLKITTTDGVKINGTSSVTKTDIKATNGVIHIIDSVVLPPDVKL
jgi:uncharacterized surface protein with fasciclin (FAS1) repeats